MLVLTLSFFGLALVVAIFCSIWMLVLGFQRHVLWGLALLLVPFAQVAFLFKEWEEAKRPFFWSFLSLLFLGAGMSTMPKGDDLAKMIVPADARNIGLEKPAPTPASNVPGMFKAQKRAELQIRLVALQKKEADLLDRKAALAPGDRAGAVALTEEIKKYNEELKPVLEQLREQPANVTAL